MAATSIPQLIAYAETVGYAGYRGLTTAGPPLAVWGIVTGSPFMNAGVTSITALMCKADLQGEAYVIKHGEEAYVQLVAAYSLFIGIASIVLAMSGFGKLAKSVPKPVQCGFKWGCAIGVLISAIPNGLFAGGGKQLNNLAHGTTLNALAFPWKATFPGIVNAANVAHALTHPLLWTVTPTILFVVGTAIVMEGKAYIIPKNFPPGTEVILVTAVATVFSMYTNYSGEVVGEIPIMNPKAGILIAGIRLPVEFLNISKLITEVPLVQQFGNSYIMLAVSSCIFAGVNFLSIMGITSGFEQEDCIAWSAERELVAQGASNVMAAAVGSAPVSGSLSRSLVSRITGTTSQMACLVTALCWIFLQPYMSIMSPTPKAALSAVIVSAVLKGVVNPQDLLNMNGLDAVIGWSTGVVTAVTSPTQGFGFGLVLFCVLSLLRGKSKLKAV
jgi:sulfate permease, SulP family